MISQLNFGVAKLVGWTALAVMAAGAMAPTAMAQHGYSHHGGHGGRHVPTYSAHGHSGGYYGATPRVHSGYGAHSGYIAPRAPVHYDAHYAPPAVHVTPWRGVHTHGGYYSDPHHGW